MAPDEPATNGTVYRLGVLEHRLERIENMELAVMQSDIYYVKDAVKIISSEVSAMKKLLMGFMATFALSTVTVVVSVATLLTQR